MSRTRVMLVVLVLLSAEAVNAADRQRIRLLNVSVHPVFTLASAAVQGRLRNREDWVRCIGWGVGSGYGYFRAKELAGLGHVRAGVAVANLAASVTRNTAAGRPAFSRLGMTVGPLRLDVSTPFDEKGTPPLHVQGSLYETVSLIEAWWRNEQLVWRGGLIAFHNHRGYDAYHRHFTGFTVGVYPGTTHDATAVTWHHESIHAIQSIQGDSLEPPACAWFRHQCEVKTFRHLIAWEPGQLGIVPTVALGGTVVQDYTERWTEIEATRLADRKAPS